MTSISTKLILCTLFLAASSFASAADKSQSRSSQEADPKSAAQQNAVQQQVYAAFAPMTRRLSPPVCKIIYDYGAAFFQHVVPGKTNGIGLIQKKDGKPMVVITGSVKQKEPGREQEIEEEFIELFDPATLTSIKRWPSGNSCANLGSYLVVGTTSGCFAVSNEESLVFWDDQGNKVEEVAGSGSSPWTALRGVGNIIVGARHDQHQNLRGVNQPTVRNKAVDKVQLYQLPPSSFNSHGVYSDAPGLLMKNGTCFFATNRGLFDLARPEKPLAPLHGSMFNELVLDEQGNLKVITASDGSNCIEIRDDQGRFQKKVRLRSPICSIARCGVNRVAVGSDDSCARIIDISSGKEVATLCVNYPPNPCASHEVFCIKSVVASEDGSLLVARNGENLGVMQIVNAYELELRKAMEQAPKE